LDRPRFTARRLKPYGAEAEARAVELLQEALRASQSAAIPDPSRSACWPRSLKTWRLSSRTSSNGGRPRHPRRRAPGVRGDKEALQMAEILEAQRKRIDETVARYGKPQLLLEFDDDERRQIDADRRHCCAVEALRDG